MCILAEYGQTVIRRTNAGQTGEELRFYFWGKELTLGCPVVVSPLPASGLAGIDEVTREILSWKTKEFLGGWRQHFDVGRTERSNIHTTEALRR